MKTYAVKASDIERQWWVVDASDQTLGRLATRIATLLEGKHKPTYSPHLDTGDHVVVVNAGRIKVTGNKLLQKRYYRHSGYPGRAQGGVAADADGPQAGARHRASGEGHAAAEPAGPGHVQEAEGLRRRLITHTRRSSRRLPSCKRSMTNA